MRLHGSTVNRSRLLHSHETLPSERPKSAVSKQYYDCRALTLRHKQQPFLQPQHRLTKPKPKSRFHQTACASHASDNAIHHAHDPAPPRHQLSPLIPIWKKNKHDSEITQLAIPALLSLLLDPVMSVIDCAIIGRLGADSLAATGASISIFSLAGLLVSFLSYVTVPAVAEASTQGDTAEVSKVIATGVWIAVVAGIAVTAFIIAVGPLILKSMGLELGVVEKANGYVWARGLGSIGHLLVLVGSGSFRGMQVCHVPYCTLQSMCMQCVIDNAGVQIMQVHPEKLQHGR